MRRIYLDYAATTPVEPVVIRAMESYFSAEFGNPSSLHSFGQRASAAVFAARRSVAAAVNADYREVFFTGSATEANNLALRGVVRMVLQENGKTAHDEVVRSHSRPKIIISSIEHESVLETAHELERDGIDVVWVPVDSKGGVDVAMIAHALDKRTVLVSVQYANGEIGSVEPVQEIADIVHNFRSNARISTSSTVHYPFLHTDAAQAFGFLDCDVNKLGVDLMTLSAHKIYGPKGIGALYMRRVTPDKQELKRGFVSISPDALPLLPLLTGGGQESGLRSGTENVSGIVGLGKAVEFLIARRERDTARIRSLRDFFWLQLQQVAPGVVMNGPLLDERLPANLNVQFPGQRANELLIKLDRAGIAVSAGSACASRSSEPSHVLTAIGLTREQARSSLRFSLGRRTTKQELNFVVRVIKDVVGLNLGNSKKL